MELNGICSCIDDLLGLCLPSLLPIRIFLYIMIVSYRSPKLCFRIHIPSGSLHFFAILIESIDLICKLIAHSMGMEGRLTLGHSIESRIEEATPTHTVSKVTHCNGSWLTSGTLYYIICTSGCRRGGNYEWIDHIKAIHMHIGHVQTPFCNISSRVAASFSNCSSESPKTNSKRA